MARTKKVGSDKYEIDFKFPHRERELLFKEDGSRRYDIAQLLQFAAGGNEYAQQFAKDVGKRFRDTGAITSNQEWTLENLAAILTPEHDQLQKDFEAWFDSRPDIQEIYAKISGDSNQWFYDRNGQYVTGEDAVARGWGTRPETWKMFMSQMNSWRGLKVRELSREVVYDVGDMVELRKPFHNTWRYDPTYGEGLPPDTLRVGTVMEHKEEISHRSRGGKGSRMINVLWLATGKQREVPERVIKKLPKQK